MEGSVGPLSSGRQDAWGAALSPGQALLSMVRIKPGSLCMPGTHFTAELDSQPCPFVSCLSLFLVLWASRGPRLMPSLHPSLESLARMEAVVNLYQELMKLAGKLLAIALHAFLPWDARV